MTATILPRTAIRWASLRTVTSHKRWDGTRAIDHTIMWRDDTADGVGSPMLFRLRSEARKHCASLNCQAWASNGFHWRPIRVRVTLEPM